MALHKANGITVLGLTAARVAGWLIHRPPPLPGGGLAWQPRAGPRDSRSLYPPMVLTPSSGWAVVSKPERRPLSWYGLFAVPYMNVPAEGAASAHEGHRVFGYLMPALVVLHVGGASCHHLIVRDGTLARMAPALER